MVQSEEERQLALEQISELQNQQEQTLKLQDSAVTGDAMVGSTKIEQQVIHNDPEAMIRMFKELKAMFNEDEN